MGGRCGRDHWPDRCDCGHEFDQGEHVAVGEPVRHQVEELPAITVTLTEHRCQRVRCPGCGRRRRAELPKEISASAFGPRLQAAVATLSVRNRISRRDVVEFASSCTGHGSAAARSTRSWPVPPTRSASPAMTCWSGCETAARCIWTRRAGGPLVSAARCGASSITSRLPARRDRPSRGPRQAAAADTKAIVTSDRWWAYSHLPLARRQICWAHLARDFEAHAEGIAAEKEFGEHGLALVRARLLGLGGLPAHPRPPPAPAHGPPAPARVQTDHPPLRRQKPAQQVLPRHGAQPAQSLARTMDLRQPPRLSSRPTTTPNAPCAAPSSTASSRLGSQSRPANNASSACSQPTSPADSNTARYSPTSPTPRRPRPRRPSTPLT